ncbi:hypothetical protein [Salinirubrum litoreum]|uniref:Uncharacterized protein n=1 Tax=Salinirubrum litoreum TaxID=1126234 RepID=A0ABD5R999_9EURY|nr:hypothetical protein [Salinirubrum litoreum]
MPLLTTLCRRAPSAATRPRDSLADLRTAIAGTTATLLALPVYLLLVGALLAGVLPDGHLGTVAGLLALTAGLRLAVGVTDLFSSA